MFAREGDEEVSTERILDDFGVEDRFRIVRVAARPAPIIGSLSYAYRTRSASTRLGHPDVYWGRQLQSLLAVAPLGWPVVYEVHAVAHTRYHHMLERRLIKSPALNRIVTISQGLRSDFLGSHPMLDPSLVIVAHDGADRVEVPPTPIEPWPGRPDTLQVGYTGHLYQGRGIEVIVELARRLPTIDVHVIGGTDTDLQRWRTLLSGDQHLSNLWFHGHQPAAAIPNYLARFDVVLAPYQRQIAASRGSDISRWISPMKLFEYMALGKAIVASNLDTIAEVLESGEHAILCPPDDVDAWEEAVTTLTADPWLRERLGQAAQDKLEHEHTWEQRVATVLAPFS